MVVFMDNKEEVIRYHELLRLIDNHKLSESVKNDYVKELDLLKTKLDDQLKAKLVEVHAGVEKPKKQVTSMKELKKQLNQKYKEIREEYASLQEQLKTNVETKKQFRSMIEEVSNAVKSGVELSEDRKAQITSMVAGESDPLEEPVEEPVEEVSEPTQE